MEFKFVRHLMERNSIRPDSQNIEKIKNAEVSLNLKDF